MAHEILGIESYSAVLNESPIHSHRAVANRFIQLQGSCGSFPSTPSIDSSDLFILVYPVLGISTKSRKMVESKILDRRI